MKMLGAAIVVLLALAAANSVFVVREGHAALLLQFGSIESAPLEPGLHFKWPFVQRADLYDTRAIVTRLRAEREPHYSQAHLHIVSGPGPHHNTVSRILEALDQWL